MARVFWPGSLLALTFLHVLAEDWITVVAKDTDDNAEWSGHGTSSQDADDNAEWSGDGTSSQATYTWQHAGTAPEPRYAHVAVMTADGKMWVFGGGPDKLEFFDTEAQIWGDQTYTASNAPKAKWHQRALVTTEDGEAFLWLMGGGAGDGTYNMDLHRFAMDSNFALDKQSVSGTQPCDRQGHSAVVTPAGVAYIFGGLCQGAGPKDDFWKINLKAGNPSWEEVIIDAKPEKRWGHSAVLSEAGKMSVFGGRRSNNVFGNDLWSIIPQDAGASWTEHAPSGTAPVGRTYHSAVVTTAGVMWVFGGFDGGFVLNDLFHINLEAQSLAWEQVQPSSSSSWPAARWRHSAVLSSTGRMWIFGGSGLHSPAGMWTTGDLWFMDVETTTTTTPTLTTSSTVSATVTSSTTRTATLSTTRSTSISSSSSGTISSSATGTTSISRSSTSSSATKSSTSTTSISSSSTRSSTATASTSSTLSTSISRTGTTTTSVSMSDSTTKSSTSTTSVSSSSARSSTRTTSTASTSRTASTSISHTGTTTNSASSTTSLTHTSTSGTSETATSSTTNSLTSSRSSSSSTTTTSSRSTSSTSSSLSTGSISSTSTSSTSVTQTSSTSSSTTSSSVTSLSSTTSSSSRTASSSRTSSTSMTSSTSATSSMSMTSSTSTTSTWTSSSQTTVTGAALETQRQEEAQQAAQAVQRAEEDAVQNLLELLVNRSQASQGGILAETDPIETAIGVVKTAALSAQDLSVNNVTIEKPGASVAVPTSVVSRASELINATGPVLLSITTMSESTAGKFTNPQLEEGAAETTVESDVVSINLRAVDGAELKVDGLSEPIEIVLTLRGSSNASVICAFWDEATQRWSQEGLTTVPSVDPSQLICRTTHLSIFAAVAGFIAEVALTKLSCATAWEFLAESGLKNLYTQADRFRSVPAISTFVVVALFALALLRAVQADRRANRALPWEERWLALLQTEQEEAEAEAAMARARSSGRCGRLAEGVLQGATDNSIRMVHSHRAGVTVDSLAILLQPGEKFDNEVVADARAQQVRALPRLSQFVHSVAQKSQAVVGQFMEQFGLRAHGTSAVRFILERPWWVRVALLFLAGHPWLDLTRVNVRISFRVRVALFWLEVATTATITALFFTSEATVDGREECRKADPLSVERIIQQAVVSLVSLIFGNLAILGLFFLQRPSVIKREEWTEELSARQQRRWRCRNRLFWVLWGLQLMFCLFYIVVFLANVSTEDAAKWQQTVGFCLVQGLVLWPLVFAIMLATLVTMSLRSRRIRQNIEAKWLELADQEPQRKAKKAVFEADSPEHSDAEPESNEGMRAVAVQDFHAVLPGVPVRG